LEARINPERIEHWIEPEQRGSERRPRMRSSVRYRKSGLAQATARAAEAAAKSVEPLPVSNTAHLRDLAQSAARIFGWCEDGMTVHANQALVITQEQLEQIRQLRGADDYEAPQSETPTREA
jgi:hypothetical protein